MARLWDDRLAEVWAEPGRAGSGVVVGDHGILTARHVVKDARGENDVLARVVCPGAETATWTPMEIAWEDPDWDLALLVVDESAHESWSAPRSPSPPFVTLGTAHEAACEAVGFPDVALHRASSCDPADLVRQPEQAVGKLLPSAVAKRSAASDQPRRVVPFDVDVAHPETTAGWKGISGAVVVLADGRIAGVVVEAEHEFQERRLYVVPVAEALRHSSTFVSALTEILGVPAVVEIRDTERFRDVLKKSCLGPDGTPLRVDEADLGAFGVARADLPGESPYLDYVERDGDAALRTAIVTAEEQHQMVLVVGGSARGTSRSTAEAVRQVAGSRLLLVPRAGRLARLEHLGVEDWGHALVWLDDLEGYNEARAPDTLEWLRDRGALVVATIRETQLASLEPRGDYRDQLGDALADRDRVTEVRWRDWNGDELARVQGLVRDPALSAWVADGRSPSAWLVAGPQLVRKFESSRDDEDHPVRYALVRTVLDWYATGIGQPMPVDLARVLSAVTLGESPRSGKFKKALKWARHSVVGSGRSVQALLSKVRSGTDLKVHEYLQDADAKGPRPAVPDQIWWAALEHAESDSGRFRIGYAAAVSANEPMAYEAWLPLAEHGEVDAMYNLGVVLKDSDPVEARRWYERAADHEHTDAMYNLGVLLEDDDPAEARRWYERAAEHDHTGAMFALGVLLEGDDPAEARRW
jgi:trypsin-like peptidase/Sel1 repeat-containing protein